MAEPFRSPFGKAARIMTINHGIAPAPVVKPVPSLFSVASSHWPVHCTDTKKTNTLCNPRFLIILVHCGARRAFFSMPKGDAFALCRGDFPPPSLFFLYSCQIRAQNFNFTATSEEGRSARHQNYWTKRTRMPITFWVAQDNHLETCPPPLPYSLRL